MFWCGDGCCIVMLGVVAMTSILVCTGLLSYICSTGHTTQGLTVHAQTCSLSCSSLVPLLFLSCSSLVLLSTCLFLWQCFRNRTTTPRPAVISPASRRPIQNSTSSTPLAFPARWSKQTAPARFCPAPIWPLSSRQTSNRKNGQQNLRRQPPLPTRNTRTKILHSQGNPRQAHCHCPLWLGKTAGLGLGLGDAWHRAISDMSFVVLCFTLPTFSTNP